VSAPIAAELGRIFTHVTGADAPAPTDDLIEEGWLDSLSLVQLLFAVEQEFAIEIPLDRFELDSFRTLERLSELVAERRAADLRAAP
jgi:acyl carrier protein